MQAKEQSNMVITSEQICAKKEKYYMRNFVALMLESFFFSAALAMFSAESVLPVYVANLSDKTIYIAMISVVNYGVSYGVQIFSCPLGVKAKSPKWISVIICFLQRIGFFFIFISTYAVTRSQSLALVLFFVSLTMYSVSSGMSNPLFSQMVSTSIHRNVGTFYGFYNLTGAASGVLGSLILTKCLAVYDFPKDYRMTFIIGLSSALLATLVVSVGVKEVTDDRKIENMSLKEVFIMGKRILKNNRNFRNFTIIRVLLGAAEFAIPYYIIIAANKPNVPNGFAGMMATVYLIAKMVSSPMEGRIGDKWGAISILRFCCCFGALAALLAIVSTSWQMTVVMYIFLAFATNGILIATSTACVVYSKNEYVPIYSATVNLLCAPLYIIVSFGGAAIANQFSYSVMFMLAFIVYLAGVILSIRFREKDK